MAFYFLFFFNANEGKSGIDTKAFLYLKINDDIYIYCREQSFIDAWKKKKKKITSLDIFVERCRFHESYASSRDRIYRCTYLEQFNHRREGKKQFVKKME